ncbi:MAG: hypothetical protein ABI193_16460 [Minicystis sp.]
MKTTALLVVLPALLVAAPAFAQVPAYFAPTTTTWQPQSPAETPPDKEPEPERPWVKNQKGFVVGLDFNGAVPVQTPLAERVGMGGDLRLGYRFALGKVWIAPEGVTGLVAFPGYESALRFGVGGRVGLDLGRFEPSVYAHGGGFLNIWKAGWGVRTGAALDVRALKFLSPGVHVDYNLAGWDKDGRVMYLAFGAHLGLVL